MFSDIVLKAIAKTCFKEVTAYVNALATVGIPFEAPLGNTIDINSGDDKETIKSKIQLVETNRHELWFNNTIVDKTGKIEPRLTKATLKAVKELQETNDLPEDVVVSLNGLKTVPIDGLHPKTVEAIVQGRLRVPEGYRYYKGGHRMVELCFIMRKDRRSQAYGMACGFSNFNSYPKGPVTLESFGVTANPDSWKYNVIIAEINATEKFIQIFKCAAQNGKTYKLEDLEKIKKALQDRLNLLIELSPNDELATSDIAELLSRSPAELLKLNDIMSAKFMKIMLECFNPKKQKKLGRGALLGGGNYFDQMDGKPFNPASPNYEELGINAIFMTVGTMIRLYQEDDQIVALMDLCKELDVDFFEAAVHCALEQQIDENTKEDKTLGCDPDLPWGACADYPRQSPDFYKVLAFSEVKDAQGTVTGFKPRKINGAFGAGLCMLAAACNDEGELGKAARRRLGLPEDVLLVVNRETIRAVAQHMMDLIKE
jgi:hypothetical protein